MIEHLSVAWSPLLPWPWLAALGALGLAVTGLALARRADGAALRGLAMAVLWLALANPSLVREQREPLDDVALVVVDESASQEIAPRPAQTAAAVAALEERLAGLPRTRVRVVRAAGGDGPEAGAGTRLFAALERALGEVPRGRVAGVFMVSDGRVHDAPETLEALGIEAPLHVLRTGREDEGDRRLSVGEVPGYGIVGRKLSLSLRVDDLPGPAGPGTARVRLTIDGEATRTLQVPVGSTQEIDFTLDHRGPTVLELEAEAGPRELTLANNHAAVSVNGVRDRLRVLLVSGEPHAGERAWRRLLKSDPSVDLVHFTILRPPEKQDGTPIRELSLIAFPTRELFEVKLEEFDLIVFDRYRRRGVLPSIYLENIAAYVEAGGALLEAVGPTFATPLSLHRTPLGRVLPGAPTGEVFERGYRPEVTGIGHRHPVTARLPGAAAADAPADSPQSRPGWGRWFRHVDVHADGGDVVMRGVRGRPLLILQRVGEGRVAQLMSDHIWLWARGYEGGGPQAELMRRVAHWLMKEPDLEEEDLRARVEGDRLEIERRSLSPGAPEVTVTRPDGSSETAALEPGRPGRASARVAAGQRGLYRVSDGRETALAAAGALNPLELRDVRAGTEAVEPVVAASGGRIVRLAAAEVPALRKVRPGRDRSGRGWLGLVANDAYRVTGIARVPLLPAVLILALGLGALVAAWYREGR